jgi:hypothetical protein
LFATKGIERRSYNRHAQNAEELELGLKMVTKVIRDVESARKKDPFILDICIRVIYRYQSHNYTFALAASLVYK